MVLDVDGGPSAAPAIADEKPAAEAGAGAGPAPELRRRRSRVEIAAGADDTLVTSTTAAARKPSSDWRGRDEPGGRRRWVRSVAIAAGVLLVLGVGAKLYIDRQWFVGVHEGNVAIFRGVNAEFVGISLASLEEQTDLSAAEAEQLSAWSGLPDGIPSPTEPRPSEVVDQIRADLERAEPPPDEEPTRRPDVDPGPQPEPDRLAEPREGTDGRGAVPAGPLPPRHGAGAADPGRRPGRRRRT